MQPVDEGSNFAEFRRKVRSAEVLSTAMERLLTSLHFTGRVSVVVQNGRVLKLATKKAIFANKQLRRSEFFRAASSGPS